jgi:hypothetical protein
VCAHAQQISARRDRWQLCVPEAELNLTLDAAFDDQELITLLYQPSFWKGRVVVTGECGGKTVTGCGLVERIGFGTLFSLDHFFLTVGNVVRDSVRDLLPDDPSAQDARRLIGSSRPQDLVGLRLVDFRDTIIRPVRALTDCGMTCSRPQDPRIYLLTLTTAILFY